jgi:hypothetical protein
MPAHDNPRLRVSRRGLRRAPLAFDIDFCCCYSCSSLIVMD